jgi:hypothetical protein
VPTPLALTGPPGLLVGAASGPFLLTPGGPVSGNFVPSDGGAGGAFSPPLVVLAGDGAAVPFSYTPAAAGSVTVGGAGPAGTTPPAGLPYAAAHGLPAVSSAAGFEPGAGSRIGVTLYDFDGRAWTPRLVAAVTGAAIPGSYLARLTVPAGVPLQAVWDDSLTGLPYLDVLGAATSGTDTNPALDTVLSRLDAIEAAMAGLADSGTVLDLAPAATTFLGSANLSPSDGAYAGARLCFVAGANARLKRKVVLYTGATRRFTFDAPFPVAPAFGDSFQVI